MTVMLSPGEAIRVPKFIEPDHAMQLGSLIRPLFDNTDGLEMAFFINSPGKFIKGEAPLSEEAQALLNEVLTKTDETLKGPVPLDEYTMITYMNSPIRRFPWHVDPDNDVRPIINIGDEPTTILLSMARGTFDPAGQGIYLDQPPAVEVQASFTLDPGDAYFLDNRLIREYRMPHATPADALGRLMLRDNRIYPTWEDTPFDFSQFDNTESISMLETSA